MTNSCRLTLQQRRHFLLELRFDWLGGTYNRARLQKIERAKGADVRAHNEIGAAVLDLLRSNGVGHDEDGREQALPRIGNVAPLVRRRAGNVQDRKSVV